MSRVKEGLSKLSALDLVSKAQFIVGRMTGNVHFPIPNPALENVTAEAESLLVAANLAETGDHLLISQRNQQYMLLANMIRMLAAYVQNASNGDAVAILSSGFDVVQKGDPVGALGVPPNFSASVKVGVSGEIFLNWDRVYGASSYVVKMTTTDPTDPQTVWQEVGYPQRSQLTVTGLTPGQVYWFIVTPNGAAGLGASTPAISMRAI